MHQVPRLTVRECIFAVFGDSQPVISKTNVSMVKEPVYVGRPTRLYFDIILLNESGMRISNFCPTLLEPTELQIKLDRPEQENAAQFPALIMGGPISSQHNEWDPAKLDRLDGQASFASEQNIVARLRPHSRVGRFFYEATFTNIGPHRISILFRDNLVFSDVVSPADTWAANSKCDIDGGSIRANTQAPFYGLRILRNGVGSFGLTCTENYYLGVADSENKLLVWSLTCGAGSIKVECLGKIMRLTNMDTKETKEMRGLDHRDLVPYIKLKPKQRAYFFDVGVLEGQPGG